VLEDRAKAAVEACCKNWRLDDIFHPPVGLAHTELASAKNILVNDYSKPHQYTTLGAYGQGESCLISGVWVNQDFSLGGEQMHTWHGVWELESVSKHLVDVVMQLLPGATQPWPP
jgi:hypothetical protein